MLGESACDQFRELILAGKGIQASSRSGRFLLASKYGDLIGGVDRERFHLSALFPTAYRDDHIHRSGVEVKQGNSARIERSHPAGSLGQVAAGWA